MSRKLLASELYAISQGRICKGNLECHWCAAPCTDSMIHDDPPLQPFKKQTIYARRPSNSYICIGCWLWRRKNITIRFLQDGPDILKDRQQSIKHSWLITEGGAWGLLPTSKFPLYRFLLKPNKRFVLSFVCDSSIDNHIQLCVTNDLDEVKISTELLYTLNGNQLSYNIYELREALKYGDQGKSPGVRTLIGLLGPLAMNLPREYKEEDKRSRGRPPRDNPLREELPLPLVETLREQPVPYQHAEQNGQQYPNDL